MLDDLKAQVCEANLKLVSYGLVFQTWGNVSGIDRQKGLVVIKPSGVAYETMQSHHMAVVSLDDGHLVAIVKRDDGHVMAFHRLIRNA